MLLLPWPEVIYACHCMKKKLAQVTNIFTLERNAPKLDFFLSKSAALEISRLLVGSSSSSTEAAISFFIVLTLLLAIVLDLIEASLETK